MMKGLKLAAPMPEAIARGGAHDVHRRMVGYPSCRPAGSFTIRPAARCATPPGAGVRSAGAARSTAGADNAVWLSRDIEACRLWTIVGRWRLVRSRRVTQHRDEFAAEKGYRIVEPDRTADASRRLRSARRTETVCAACGSPALSTPTLCERCRVLNNLRVNARSDRLAAAGLCIACGRASRVIGGTRCVICRDKRRRRA